MLNRTQVLEKSADYFQLYISYVPENVDIVDFTAEQLVAQEAFFRSIPEDKLEYRYAEGKWTPKEILGHMTDCERIFQCRILRFARNDKTDLPGFEENDYVMATDFNARSLDDLLEEARNVRAAGVSLYRSLTEDERWRSGT
ncbi:MAG: DinB family protein, partial [Bacteroidota bacterium]